MKFTLPLPPSVNASYAAGKNRKTGKSQFYKTDVAKEWEQEAMQLIMVQKVHQAKPKGDTVYTTFYRNDKRKWDSNNAIKILYDVLVKKQIIRDDSDIVFEQIQKQFVTGKKSYCEVEIL